MHFDDEFAEPDEHEIEYPLGADDDAPAGESLPLRQPAAPDYSGGDDAERWPLGEGGQLVLQEHADFARYERPEMERHRTLEDVRGATPRGFHLEESSGRSGGGPLSPANPLGQSMQSNGHSTVGEDIDVSTEGLIDETMERLSFVHGVQGVLIIDRDGMVVRSTMANDAARYAAHMLPLLERAKLCTEAVEGSKGRFQMLCVRTRKHEMLMCTEKDMHFSILIIQDPNVESIPAVLPVESR